MNEQLVLFEGQEVKVKTDEGKTLINLVHTAKCCGLIRTRNDNQLIRWDDVKKKLKSICGSVESSTPQYIDETQYILDEIDNADDRNAIYMSSWLSKRMAMECKSDKAMQYKNFLATLDEKRENGQLEMSNDQLSKVVSDTINNILPTMIKGITEQFAPVLIETKNIVDTQKKNNETAQENLERLIGIRSRNTNCIGKKLTARESEFYGRRIYATAVEHKLNRNKLLNHFNVMALEDIPARKYNDILDYVENMELVPVKEVEKYKTTPRSNKCEYLKLVESI